jgi:hypothetical protein
MKTTRHHPRFRSGTWGALLLATLPCSLAAQPPSLDRVATASELPRAAIYGDAPVPAGTGFAFSVLVVRNAGWQVDEVATSVRDAATIFLRRCNLPLTVERVLTIDLPAAYQELDEDEEERLVSGLDARPAVLFVNRTSEGHRAYSYLERWPIARAGTAWLTRQAPAVCRGALLAHEIAHLALDDAGHSDDPDNLMSHRCGHSNLTNQLINTELDPDQCRLLARRFCRDGGCRQAAMSPLAPR